MSEPISGTAAAAAVRVLSVSHVVPSPAPASGAGSVNHVKLSFLDVAWVKLPPIQRVFLYELPGAGAGEFSAVVARLKESLSATLGLYLPLAGKLAKTAGTTGGEYEFVVDCSDPRVAFVEAEVTGGGQQVDVRRLADDEALDIPAFLALVPELEARVLSVQATRLGGGAGAGLALGLSVLHTVVDGAALWRFTEAWASASREGSPVTRMLGPPHYDREAVFHPRGDEFIREIMAVALDLPPARNLPVERRTFYLSADDVLSLRRRIDGLALALAEAGGDGEAPRPSSKQPAPVSSFVALSALCWTAFVRSKGFAAGADTHLMFPADLRARLDPPVGEGYLGNCVSSCLASADAGQLLPTTPSGLGLLRAARAIQAAVAETEAAAAAAALPAIMARRIRQLGRVPFERLVCVVASPRFRVYDASDFGFGRPRRVELVSMIQDGQVVLGGGRRSGEVQLSVSLHPACVDAFKAHAFS